MLGGNSYFIHFSSTSHSSIPHSTTKYTSSMNEVVPQGLITGRQGEVSCTLSCVCVPIAAHPPLVTTLYTARPPISSTKAAVTLVNQNLGSCQFRWIRYNVGRNWTKSRVVIGRAPAKEIRLVPDLGRASVDELHYLTRKFTIYRKKKNLGTLIFV